MHHRAGSLDDDVFEGKIAGFRNAVWGPLGGGPMGLRASWKRSRGQAFSNDFRVFMDKVIIGSGPPSADPSD